MLSLVALAFVVLQGTAAREGPGQTQPGPQRPQQQQAQQPTPAAPPSQPSTAASGFDERTLERVRALLVQSQALALDNRKADVPLFRVEVFGRRFQLADWQKKISPATSAPQPFGGADYYEMMRLITPPQYWGSASMSNRDVLNLAITAGETWLGTYLVKKAIAAERNAAPRRLRKEVQQELAEIEAHNAGIAAPNGKVGAAEKDAAEKKKQEDQKKEAAKKKKKGLNITTSVLTATGATA